MNEPTISDILDVRREYRKSFSLKAERTHHRVTFNPSSAQPGETLYIHLPKLSENIVLIPGSVGLLFDLTLKDGSTSDANKTVVNNLGRNLVFRMRTTLGGEIIQDSQRWDLYQTYNDLFLTKEERNDRVREGISSEEVRKHRTEAGDKDSSDEEGKILASIYGNKYKIPLTHPILDSHGVFYSKALEDTLTFELTLPESKKIVVSSQGDVQYGLTNLELEYECISSDYLAQEALRAYHVGKGFYYDNVVLYKPIKINEKNDTVINEHINIPRRSMSGILMIFIEQYTACARDSEKFANPNITHVEINVDGMPNKMYSKGMSPPDFWKAIVGRYGLSDNITPKEFYEDKFALWIDLRTYPDPKAHGNGLVLNNTQDGVKLLIKRKASTTEKYLTCYIFVVADAVVEIEGSSLKAITY